MNYRSISVCILILTLATMPFLFGNRFQQRQPVPPGRTEVVFWHFWGGEDKNVVDDVVLRFNRSQELYFVRAVAMPGNNLQAKLFLSVAGGDPPDLVNQDDPILPDWARRGVIHAMDEIADPAEVASVRRWMLESAQRLSVFDDRMYAVCNGLDIRALYYNKSALNSRQLSPPTTIGELDAIASMFTTTGIADKRSAYGYLPDSRRLWAWGYVFGGDFFDPASHQVRLNTPAIQAALNWMSDYPRRLGADEIAAFRKGDQSLPGKSFPLLPILDAESVGRYVMIMDGQWRVRDITTFQKQRQAKGLAVPEFGVCSLPVPNDLPGIESRKNAGWVNGNFFVVPRGAKSTAGAWEFAKFWIGYSDASEAARTCADGGWIPVSNQVIEQKKFQDFLAANPLFKPFVELASSPNQFPTPQVPGAAMFRRTVENAAYDAMTHPDKPVKDILADAESRIQIHLDRVLQDIPRHVVDPSREESTNGVGNAK